MKRAYSRLERDDTGIIRVVFYDADTSLPVDDLSGYTIVAIDNQGQAVPINSVQSTGNTTPTQSADLPRLENPPMGPDAVDRPAPNVRPTQRENGGAVPGMDLEPTGRFVGPGGLVGLALGNEYDEGNTGWKNKALTTGVGMLAGAALGGIPGVIAGTIAKGVVDSDTFKNKYNSRGQLSPIGVGMGLPDVPDGPIPEGMSGFAPSTPTSTPTPTSAPRTQSVGPSGQASSIPENSPPVQQASFTGNVARNAPSMGAFNRTVTPQTGYRQGLNPEIDAVASKMETEFGRTLNSGFRDPSRNARVGGAKNSEHTRGNAVDVGVSSMTNEEKRSMLEAAVQSGVRGVGIYNSGRSIHLDTREQPTTWGPRGFTGSPVSEMPEWSQNTLSAMYGAGPGGKVLTDKGPMPTSRDEALANMPQKSRPMQDDLAFTSRPDFSNMTTGKIAASGFGTKPDNKTLNAMAYTLAGELGPKALDDPKAIANLAATINNRVQSVGAAKTFTPSQYNSLSPSARAVTDANYKKHGWGIKSAIENYYDGLNAPQNPDATHYYNPDLVNPAWGSSMTNVSYEAGHRIGTIPGEYKTSTATQQAEARRADDAFTSKSLASQAGRNVENTDKAMSGDKRTSVGSRASSTSSDGGGRGFASRSNNSSVSSRSGSGKDKDDRGIGAKSSSSSKPSASRSNNSSISSRSGSGKDKDDKGVGAKSSVSSGSKSKSGGNSSVSGRSGSGKDKDDKGVGSKSSSKSSGGGKKSGGNATW